MIPHADKLYRRAIECFRGTDDPGPDAPADEMIKEGRKRSQGRVEDDLDDAMSVDPMDELALDVEPDHDDLEDF